jgi:hypothetical protein
VREPAQLTMHVGGLGFMTAGAWTVSNTFGLVAAGIACLVLEWRYDAQS